MDKKKQIEIIEEKAKEAGVSLAELFRKADVPYNTIQNWRNQEPSAFQTVEKLNQTLEEIKAYKLEAQNPTE